MLKRILLIAVMVVLTPIAARADLIFTLNPAQQTGSPGNTLVFNATLTNTGTDTLFLNGVSYSVPPLILSLDDSNFFNNVPEFLTGGSSFTGNIFDVTISPTTAPGNYFGSFTILGGSDIDSQTALATQTFMIAAQSSPSTMPEPMSFILLGTGLAGILFRVSRRKKS